MKTTAVIRLSDMTFILMKDEKVLIALSYRKNAAALAFLLKALHIDELYMLVEPNIEIDKNKSIGNIISEWNINNISFSLLDSDIESITYFAEMVNAKNTFIVNSLFDYGYFSRLPSFNLVKTYKDSYAYLSYENKNLSYIQINNKLEDLLSANVKFYDEMHIIDADKVKGRFPELAYREAIEIAALAPLLYATTNSLKISVKDLIKKENIQELDENNIIEEDNEAEIEENIIDIEQELDTQEDSKNVLPNECGTPNFINIPEEPSKHKKQKLHKHKTKRPRVKKKSIFSGALTACIVFLSICVGIAFGTRSFPGYIATLSNELHLISEETKLFNEQEVFYQSQIEKLNGRQNTSLNIYTDLNNIPVQGLLGEMRAYSDSNIAIYYLLNADSIDPLVEKIEEKYTVSSVSATDTIKLNDNTVSVFSITLH